MTLVTPKTEDGPACVRGYIDIYTPITRARAHTGAADPALMAIRSGKVRRAGKQADEGVAHAAHLLISTTTHLSKAGESHSLLERVPNLGRGTVIAFLNRVIRRQAKETGMRYKDEEDGRMKRCHPKLVPHQQMSHRLKADLAAGKLSRIEFITHKVVDGFEEDSRVIPVSQTLVHKVVNPPSGNLAFDLLEKAKAFAKKHNFEEMQIRFRKSDTGQSVSPRFATDLSDAQDAVYSRFEVLSRFNRKLEQCPVSPVADIKKKMAELFEKPEMWK